MSRDLILMIIAILPALFQFTTFLYNRAVIKKRTEITYNVSTTLDNIGEAIRKGKLKIDGDKKQKTDEIRDIANTISNFALMNGDPWEFEKLFGDKKEKK